MFGFRIIRERKLRKMLKDVQCQAFTKGFECGCHMDRNRGTIMAEYDLDKELEKILREKGG